MTSNFLSLDLELMQPSRNIIQIGAVVGNVLTGEVLERLAVYINAGEKLSNFIINLTGIQQEDVDEGISLLEGYSLLKDMHSRHECFLNPITWGGDDSNCLRSQLTQDVSWCFGRRHIDVKTLFVSSRIAKNLSIQGGLAKSMVKEGLKFKGRKHDALDDAENTFYMYCKLLEYFK